MLAIGISRFRWFVFEGDGSAGYEIVPPPMISVATVLKDQDSPENITASELEGAEFIFREDSFDPITRIRRGRIYKSSSDRLRKWSVQFRRGTSSFEELHTFHSWSAFNQIGGFSNPARIALGTKNAFTIWRVVDIERIVTGEDLLTLRARSALGSLPELNFAKVPAGDRGSVGERLDKLARSAYTADPESTIDMARGAAQWCIGVWLAHKRREPKLREDDLGRLSAMLREEKKDVSSHLGHILARLHPRAKPNERERLKLRSLRDSDAEFALAAVGMLLRELEWTA